MKLKHIYVFTVKDMYQKLKKKCLLFVINNLLIFNIIGSLHTSVDCLLLMSNKNFHDFTVFEMIRSHLNTF